ncbi:NUDIX domain-containing protein [Streptomyces sp. HSW2009]|uniref:NUDIX hydrolase n=1 Tax=Streptomyces sp. HSW2009 TaxID=3142890 RepID=UPI0032EF5D86
MEHPVDIRTRVSAYAIVVEADRLLLTRLSAASPVFAPGLWHLPGGGIDPGEQPAQALARELHEESGRTPRAVRLVDAKSYTAHRNGTHWHLTGLFYAVDLAPGTLRVTETDGATSAVDWHRIADLTPELLSPAAIDALELLPRAAGWRTGLPTD